MPRDRQKVMDALKKTEQLQEYRTEGKRNMSFKHKADFTYETRLPSDHILPGMELDKDYTCYNVSQIKDNLLYYMGIGTDQAGFDRDEKGNNCISKKKITGGFLQKSE